MFNGTQIMIDAFVERLERAYHRNYGTFEPSYGEILSWAGRMALERIAQTDALYHDVEHTIMVTLVGQEILRGKHLAEGGVKPRDWLHFTISLLCHDIGYVRGVCRGDQGRVCSTGVDGGTVEISVGATDACMTPYHIDRAKEFVRARFAKHAILDAEEIARNIEHTRFPVPKSSDYSATGDFPGLVRAADLVGQLADPRYMRKLAALFWEFHETGTNAALGYAHPDDLRRGYPGFFWNVVSPFVKDALRFLRVTQEGQEWIANLYAHVFAVEHDAI
jgi:hypothetical protein